MTETKYCRVCGDKLGDDNCYSSYLENNNYICKLCSRERNRSWRKENAEYFSLWRKENPDMARAISIRHIRKMGALPFDKNRECASFLGVHVAERVLRHVFNDVERMPMNNPGYDIKCNRDKLIDIKSSCLNKSGGWMFTINRNTIADFFLCIAFDNRKSLNPLHVWLLPGSEFNHLSCTRICPNTIHKWDEYKLDISKISACCDAMRGKQ